MTKGKVLPRERQPGLAERGLAGPGGPWRQHLPVWVLAGDLLQLECVGGVRGLGVQVPKRMCEVGGGGGGRVGWGWG